MSRLPSPGSDDNAWGGILNDFLLVAHNSDGTLQTSAISSADGEITSRKGQASGYAGLNSSGIVPTAQLGSGSASSSNFLRGDGTWAVPSGGSSTLASDSDVAIVSPTNNQVLTYNTTSSKWVNQTPSSAPNATPSTPGLVQLTNDLGGTATAPQVTSTHLAAALPVNQGGTGSTTQNFVDLTTTQSIAGTKTFSTKVATTALQVSGGSIASGKVLTSDGSGNASWQVPVTNQQTISSKTADYTLTTNDEVILADASGGSLTLTLPTAASNTNLYVIKKIDSSSNTVTIDTTSSQTIDGGSTAVIRVQYASISLVSNGSNWFVI